MKNSSLKQLLIGVIFLFGSNALIAQTCTPTAPVCVAPGGNFAFRYANNTNFGLKFNDAVGVSEYQFTNGSGAKMFGIGAVSGNLSLGNVGALQVGANRFAFQFSGDPDAGLFFAAGAPNQYQFRSLTGANVFTINENDGSLVTGGRVAINSSLTNNSLASKGPFTVGLQNANHLALDNNEVQAYFSNSGYGTLYLNFFGGNVDIASSFGGDRNVYVHDNTLVVEGTNNRVGIGTYTPAAKLEIQGNASTTENVVRSTSNYVGNSDVNAVNATSITNPGYGIGVYGTGGYIGTYGSANSTTYTGTTWGVYGVASGSAGTRIGVFGQGFGGTINWAFWGFGNAFLSGGTWQTSDRKLKNNIQPISGAIEKINQLNGKTYTYKTEEYAKLGLPKGNQFGLIAQEVEKVFPDMVMDVEQAGGPDDRYAEVIMFKSINYTELIPVLIEGIKEQQKMIDSQNQMIKEQQSENVQLKNEIILIKQIITQLQSDKGQAKSIGEPTIQLDKKTAPWLGQNIPNPFDQTSNIPYFLPETVKSGIIKVYDLDGKEVQSFIVESSKGSVTFNKEVKSAGTYIYTLWGDGELISSKKMISK